MEYQQIWIQTIWKELEYLCFGSSCNHLTVGADHNIDPKAAWIPVSNLETWIKRKTIWTPLDTYYVWTNNKIVMEKI